MSIAAALAELEKSPALPDHIAHLQEVLAEESERRARFHTEYEGRRGEFINGRIYVSPSGRLDEIEIIGRVRTLIYLHVSRRRLGETFGGKCLVHCQRNDYEPSVCFFGKGKAASFTKDFLLFPPPDLAVEVFTNTSDAAIRRLKWSDYARHEVGEYWTIDVESHLLEQHVLPPGAEEYRLKARLPDGARLDSVVLTDFSVPVAAFFDAGEHQRAVASAG